MEFKTLVLLIVVVVIVLIFILFPGARKLVS